MYFGWGWEVVAANILWFLRLITMVCLANNGEFVAFLRALCEVIAATVENMGNSLRQNGRKISKILPLSLQNDV
jgi:hypothetical protein